ncbi:hypothetical protein LSM04_009406 [Trypanosoma melophagium]|uniref:uncharacterized protein n=1 Tax=Trypanosoma melophagium TaxID=715481 RepID=UPI00351A8E85|nr:hypothetical protein LSM04_009406 [Trypanosoma melophagium]
MEGVGTPPPTDGATVSTEVSTTDGNQGGRCVVESTNSNSDYDVYSVCERTSLPVISRTLISHSEALHVMLKVPQKEQEKEKEESGTPLTSSRFWNSCIYKLPVTTLESIFTFLPTTDLCTVLGVSRFFYSAANASDYTAWKSACLSLWSDKEGFVRLVGEWTAIKRECRQEELELISLQQQIIKGEQLEGAEASFMDVMMQKWDVAENEKEKCMKEQQLPSVPNYQRGHDSRSEETSLDAITYRSDNTPTMPGIIVNKNKGLYQQEKELWGAFSLRNTPTYEAIKATKLPASLRTSLISPLPCNFLSAVSTASSPSCCGTTGSNRKLHWWEIKEEERQRHLSLLAMKSLRQQQQRRDGMSPLLLDGTDDEHDEKSTNSSFQTEISRTGGSNSAQKQQSTTNTSSSYPGNEADSSGGSSCCMGTHLMGGFLGPAETPTSGRQSEGVSQTLMESISEDGLNNDGSEEEENEDEDEDENLVGKQSLKNPYQESEEKMAMARALSLQLLHTKRDTRSAASHKQGKEEYSNIGNISNNAGNEKRKGKIKKWKREEEDDDNYDEMYIPVSWKFAYYMSLRDSRCERLTMQGLMETTWYICFRYTGSSHPVKFKENGTLIIDPTPCTLNSGSDGNSRRNGSISSRSTTSNQSSAVQLPPFTYQLLKGGTELEVQTFPSLKVRRRLGKLTGDPTNTASTGSGRSTNSAAECAFNAEPDTTLRRLGVIAAAKTNTNKNTNTNPSVNREWVTPGYEENTEGIPQNDDTALDVAEVTTIPGQANEKSTNNDWGWVIQNYFVKIFSVDTPLPLYIHRLRRTCAPRPP